MKRNRSKIDLIFTFADHYARIGAARSAAALAYFLILTLFPLLLCVSGFAGQFHGSLEPLLPQVGQFLPAGVIELAEGYLAYVSEAQSGALLWAGLVTIVLSASAGLRTLLDTLDVLYGRTGGHPVRRLIFSLLLSVLLLLTVYLSVVVIFTGDWFFRLLRQRLPAPLLELVALPELSALWRWMRYLLLFCFVLLLVLVIYRAGAPRRLVGDRVVLLSALCAALAMVVGSAVFSALIGVSSRYALVYGSLASLMICLVWLYFCGNVLLLGAILGWMVQGELGVRS